MGMIVGGIALGTLFVLLIACLIVGGEPQNKPAKHQEDAFGDVDEVSEGHMKFLNAHPLSGHIWHKYFKINGIGHHI